MFYFAVIMYRHIMPKQMNAITQMDVFSDSFLALDAVSQHINAPETRTATIFAASDPGRKTSAIKVGKSVITSAESRSIVILPREAGNRLRLGWR
jgi:hypothetical protein